MINCTFENGGKASLRHVVVHAIVEMDKKLLLVKRAANLLNGGRWGLPSGFLDRNETAKEGILRELKEETGWKGEVVKLFRINSNPNRPREDRQNVPLTFIVKAIKKVGEPDHESSAVDWFPIANLPPLEELAFDHGETIKMYLDYKKEPFPLPQLT